MVPVLFVCSVHAEPNSPPPPPDPADAEDVENYDGAAAADAYRRAETALYDQLRADSSPRQQVLAGRIYLADDDSVPSALRPKRETIVARAAQLAPDDALVQWIAASDGSYASSACGPTTWPEAEVANLIRLEPDNAAAWQFAVALAGAKGDQAGIDEALSRMATAARADGHYVEQLDEWKKAYAALPEATTPMARMWHDAPPSANALLSALQQVEMSSYSSAKSGLENICKPDASSDRAWQRLGWCADAAHTLAASGSSLALRKQGLELFAAIGDHSDSTAELQRQYDWLDTHSTNPLHNFQSISDGPESLLADWQGANTEVAAIERHLERTGQPLRAPAGWLKEQSANATNPHADGSAKAYEDYLRSLIQAMRASSDVHQRALALGSAAAVAMIDAGGGDEAAATGSKSESIADFAAGHADDLLVQWVAAHAKDADAGAHSTATAIANLQRLDGDNAAALALSLSENAGQADAADAILARMAASRRYDEHTGEILTAWLDAVRYTPPPTELGDAMGAMADAGTVPADTVGKGFAMMMTNTMAAGAQVATEGICGVKDAGPRKDSCVAIGRLELHAATTMITTIHGEHLLRMLDAMDAQDATRARQIAWWRERLTPAFFSDSGQLDDFVADIRAGGEIEALRHAAERSGKGEPPAEWKSAAEKHAGAKNRRID